MNNRKAYLIDAERQRITNIEIDARDGFCLPSVYKAIGGGCDLIEAAAYTDNGDCLMVDEEGWRRSDYVFAWDGEVIAGNGILVGPADEEGYTCDVQSSELDCAFKVDWPTPVGFKLTPELKDELQSEMTVIHNFRISKPNKKKE